MPSIAGTTELGKECQRLRNSIMLRTKDDAGDEQEARHDEVLDHENGPSYGAVGALVLRPMSSRVFFHLYEGY